MLMAALDTEAADYVERHRHERGAEGRALVVHNGSTWRSFDGGASMALSYYRWFVPARNSSMEFARTDRKTLLTQAITNRGKPPDHDRPIHNIRQLLGGNPMEPVYFAEKRYSYHISQWTPPVFSDYQSADPATYFEKKVQQLFLQGNDYLQKEEFNLALNAFRQLQNLILTTVHPALPIDTYLNRSYRFPVDISLLDVFTTKAGAVLNTLPLKTLRFSCHRCQ